MVVGSHFGAPKNKAEGKRDYTSTMKFLNNQTGIIFDRWALGERVYGPLFRKYYPDYMDKIENELKDHNYLFLITASVKVVRKRILESRHQGKENKYIETILKSFEREFKKSKYPNKFIIDTTNITPDEAADQIIEFIRKDCVSKGRSMY